MENVISKEEMNESITENSETKKEILELILKFFYENNYIESARLLEEKAKITYHQNEIQQLKILLSNKQYSEAIDYLSSNQTFEQSQKTKAINLIKIRNFFEILRFNIDNTNNKKDILSYLRNEISPIIPNNMLNKYSSLLFIKEKEVLEENLKMNFDEIINDTILTNKIQNIVCLYGDSDSNNIHNMQLEDLLKTYQEIENSNYNYRNPKFTYKQIGIIENLISSKNDSDNDEIWDLKFSNSVSHFATCLRNGTISIFNINYNQNTLKIKCISSFQAHKKYITYISWSSNDTMLLTSSNDKTIKIWNPFEGKLLETIQSHTDIVSCALFYQNDEKIISGGIDKKLISTVLLSNKSTEIDQFSCIRQILLSESLKSIIIIPASLNDIVIYDYTINSIIGTIEEPDLIISSEISRTDKGRFLITNVSNVNANINLYNLQTKQLVNKYYGHRQGEYIIMCSFAGKKDEYIICGSEDGSIFIWHRNSSIAIHEIKGHTGVVNACNLIYLNNCEFVFSVSDDHTIRIWSGEEKIKFEYENKAKRIEDTKSNLALLMSDDVEMSDSESERENEEQNNNNSDENESNDLNVDSDN